jgi:TIR domain
MTDSSNRFRVAFSFAGEKRDFVASLARILADRFGEAAILYDKYHEAEFAQWRLGLNLPALYHDQSDLIVVVVCSAYSEKNWCGLEWLAIHGMLMSGKNRDVMLCRFDHAKLQGLYENAGFVELDHKTPEEAARRILERLALNEGKPKDHYIQDAESTVTRDKPDTPALAGDDFKPLSGRTRRRKLAIIVACLLILILAAAVAYKIIRVPPLTDKDTLVLADFTNNTGEQVFDNTLREALAIDFGQSPFLQMVSDRRIRETLRLMERPPDQRITGEFAREVCLRTGARATVAGTISKLGNHYPIQLKAVICDSEKVLAATEAEAGSREQTLQALHQAGSELRRKLGESREILKIYDKPLEEVTTSSLNALYAYSDAYRAWRKKRRFCGIAVDEKSG